MTATLDLDLTSLLCRYAIDPGALRLAGDPCAGGRPGECGVPGSRRPAAATATARTPTRPAASRWAPAGDAAVPGSTDDGGLLGVPRRRHPVITRRTKLQLLAFLAVSLLGISYLGFNYVGLDRVLLGSGYDVAADFEDSGGIFVNAEVTYRGVAVGRVSDMELTDDGVRVVMTIEPDAEPDPGRRRGPGRQPQRGGGAVRRPPPGARRRPLPGGRRGHPAGPHSIPIPVEQLLLNVDQLANSIDEENLRIVVDELGRAFAGAGDDLGRLIDNGDLLLARAEESLPQTLRLITDGQTVLDTQVDSRSAIRAWARDLRQVTDTLVELDPEFRELVVNAPDAGAALEQLIRDAGPGLGGLVRNLDILNRVQLPRMDGIRQMLVTYPDVVSGGFTVVRRDEDGVLRSHFGFVPNPGEPHSCTSGYVPTSSTRGAGAVESLDTDRVRCLVVNGRDPQPADGHDETGSNIRGEQNIGRDGGVGAPGPGGGLPGAPRRRGPGAADGAAGRRARRAARRRPDLPAARMSASTTEAGTPGRQDVRREQRRRARRRGARRDGRARAGPPAEHPARAGARRCCSSCCWPRSGSCGSPGPRRRRSAPTTTPRRCRRPGRTSST